MNDKTDKEVQFEDLLSNHLGLVYKTALAYAGNDDKIAKEVVQNTFMQLHKHLENMEPKNIKPWLVVTTKIHAIGRSKKKSRIKESPICNDGVEKDVFLELFEKNPLWFDAVTLVSCLGIPEKEVAAELKISLIELYSILKEAEHWINENYYDKIEQVEV